MTALKLTLTALTLAALAGCNASPVTPVAPAEKFLTVVGKLTVQDETGYKLLAVKKAYNLADIHHVNLALWVSADGGTTYTSTGATKVLTSNFSTLTTSANPLYAAISLSTLKYGRAYKLVATAYNATTENTGTQIDSGDANCVTTFTTAALTAGTATNSTNGDTVEESYTINGGVINLKLTNKTFAGAASAGSGMTVTNGTIVNPTATEVIN